MGKENSSTLNGLTHTKQKCSQENEQLHLLSLSVVVITFLLIASLPWQQLSTSTGLLWTTEAQATAGFFLHYNNVSSSVSVYQ